jgi:hypothetical protein
MTFRLMEHTTYFRAGKLHGDHEVTISCRRLTLLDSVSLFGMCFIFICSL